MKTLIAIFILMGSVALAPATRPDFFQQASIKHGVSVKLLHGIAYAETGAWKGKEIRATIRSSSGAIGFMQIMPKTGAHHCPGRDLENPAENIECGALYIAWIQRYYCGKSVYCVAASYLNGPNAVRRGHIGRHTFKYYRKVWKKL